jgi:Lipocalin-like domain
MHAAPKFANPSVVVTRRAAIRPTLQAAPRARISCGVLGLALIASVVSFAACAGDMAKPSLEGTWTLKSAYNLHQDGSKTFGFGPKPQGILMIDKQGHYSLQIFRSDEPTYATDAKGMRTAFKANEIASTHYGQVSLDPEHHTITFRIELAYFPRWNGTVQVRPYTLSADELSYQVPAQPGSDSVAVSVWQRGQSMGVGRDP